jgi:hypothetical protein
VFCFVVCGREYHKFLIYRIIRDNVYYRFFPDSTGLSGKMPSH